MSRKQILEKAIKKAIDNGWKGVEGITDAEPYLDNLLPVLIFNHDFAKALWGEKLHANPVVTDLKTYAEGKDPIHLEKWQYHLQQLVIADDVFKYLEENI